MPSSIEIGAEGERIAAEWLRHEGFVIRDTNWRSGSYELDIVAQRDEWIHFVEVKTRSESDYLPPEAAMTRSKARSLLRAANAYISLYNIDLDCCIDLIAIDTHRDGTHSVRYIPSAVELHW